MVMKNNWMSRSLSESDPEIARAIANEANRQHEGLELIASENFVSMAVLEAAGSVFTNKYAEGYPGKPYYLDCEFAYVFKTVPLNRTKEIFCTQHVNVHPHSLSHANISAYMALLQP